MQYIGTGTRRSPTDLYRSTRYHEEEAYEPFLTNLRPMTKNTLCGQRDVSWRCHVPSDQAGSIYLPSYQNQKRTLDDQFSQRGIDMDRVVLTKTHCSTPQRIRHS